MNLKNLLKRFSTPGSEVNEFEKQKILRESQKAFDHFMGRINKLVSCHQDSEAICLLMDKYDYFKVPVKQFEELFIHVQKWGPSRTLLCLGRLIIDMLNEEKRHGRALYFIEQCQQVSPQFILPKLSQTVFYSRMALESDRPDVAKNLITDSEKRYGDLVNLELCKELKTLLNMG